MADDASSDITPPSVPKAPLTVDQARLGRTFTPQIQIRMYSPDEWEAFVEEWAYYSVVPKYAGTKRFGGPGDRGLDVVGFVDSNQLRGVWDCYQCKHYSLAPLTLTEALPDVGKV